MRAICLHQPLASLVVIGAKRWETRSKDLHYRGPLAICSTAKPPNAWMARRVYFPFRKYLKDMALPVGHVLGVVDLTEVVSTLTFLQRHCGRPESANWLPDEITFGDYGPDRYAWKLERPRQLAKPVPVKGCQFIFFLPPEVEQQVSVQLSSQP